SDAPVRRLQLEAGKSSHACAVFANVGPKQQFHGNLRSSIVTVHSTDLHSRDQRSHGPTHARIAAEVIVKLIGVLLIVFGVVALVLGGIRYTTNETVVDVGPIHATA